MESYMHMYPFPYLDRRSDGVSAMSSWRTLLNVLRGHSFLLSRLFIPWKYLPENSALHFSSLAYPHLPTHTQINTTTEENCLISTGFLPYSSTYKLDIVWMVIITWPFLPKHGHSSMKSRLTLYHSYGSYLGISSFKRHIIISNVVNVSNIILNIYMFGIRWLRKS